MTESRRRIGRILGWVGASVVLLVLLAVGAGLLLLDSVWGKDRIRQVIEGQANRFLSGTLQIERIDGSILSGIGLQGVRLVQDGIPVVTVERATLSYGLRELYEGGTIIRRLRLEGLSVVGDRQADGGWNLGRLVRPRPAQPPSGRPARLIALPHVELVDATVQFRDPLRFGAAYVPTRFDDLDAVFAFEWRAPAWNLTFARASWTGRAPALTMTRLSGGIGTDGSGWRFADLRVETPRSTFTVNGALRRLPSPTTLDLNVAAERFAFQEWGGVLTGLRNIAIESAFSTTLNGPLDRLATTLELQSNGGAIRGSFVLDSTVPGWHGSGTADVNRLNVSPWFNRPERPSDITGRVTFDLDLDLGRRFPRGTYAFSGSHAAYLGYAADHVRARGRLTATEAVLESVTATAYGADVRVQSGAIGIDAPYRYRFSGHAAGVDLRRLPRDVPVPHVESTLVLDYRVRGQFVPGLLTGDAVFGASEFLGAHIGSGTVGTIDTSATPVRFAGEGAMTDISLRRFGDGLDVAWMRDPRYDGVVAGRFHVAGAGAEAATMTLDGGGQLTRAELFGGVFEDADVSVRIAEGTLRGTYDGRFRQVDPARALGDDRWAASLTGRGVAAFVADGLLVRVTSLADYSIDATASLADSVVRGVAVDRASIEARLAGQSLRVASLEVAGPTLQASGQGTLELDGARSAGFDFDLVRGDLAALSGLAGRPVSGQVSTQGRVTGPLGALRVTGNARVTRTTIGGLEVLTGGLAYDATVPPQRPRETVARVSGAVGPLTIGGQPVNEVSLAANIDRGRVTLDVRGTRAGGLNASLVSAFTLDAERRAIEISRLDLQVQRVIWRLVQGSMPRLTWNDTGLTVFGLAITDAQTEQQRLSISGDWRPAENGVLAVQASRVSLDALAGVIVEPPRYAGRLDADVAIRPADRTGQPVVTGTFSITEGRVRRLGFDRLAAAIGYDAGLLDIDARLDQAPGVWLTALGTVPLALFVEGQPDLPMQVAVTSSLVDLAVVEGLTETVRDVSGGLQVDVTAVGSAKDPHVEGTVAISDGGFVVRATGARYRNARVNVALTRDQVTVKALHVEDARGHALDVTGSLGTHELRVGDLAVTARARQFEVLRNEFGNTEVDADLDLRGQFESPRLTGTIAITGGDLRVDEILDRVLLRPYSTEAAPVPVSGDLFEADPLAVLNPWQRMGIDLAVTSRGTLHLVGDNVQVSAGTPLGLGNVNVRAYGELYLYKDPGQPLFVTGSFDSLTGTYAFQGRRFDLDPASSINFRGDLTPELYVTVRRTITAVETRVSIIGPLNEPELRLSSSPPLDDSNILALIVFNTTINELNAVQQQELAVRAGTLAAGFLATPLVTALERSLGLDILEIELQPSGGSGATTASPRITVGDEIAPGLIARFSRQFGEQEYSEASLEYYLSRLFRIRATFSDAGSLLARSPFRRVERAGIDFLVFFSF